MREEEGFLRAIAAAPMDDLPRLVYADWLEERGDPRSIYLRLATQAAGQIRNGLVFENLRFALHATCEGAVADWRRQVGPWVDVVLESVHEDCKIGVIKVIYNLVTHNLHKAVDLVEFLPSIVLSRNLLDEAEELREQLKSGYGITPWQPEWGPACQVTLRISSQIGEPEAARDRGGS
jgi:uncharacterized protein (TIGR02996 family)